MTEEIIEKMSDTKDLELTYTGVSVASNGVAVVSTVIGDLAEQNIDHTLVYFWIERDWSAYKTPNAITSMCWPKTGNSETYCLSADGKVFTIYEDAAEFVVIDDSEEGPSDLVIMKEIRLIDDKYYVVGMARRAYHSTNPKIGWQAIDSTCFVPRAKRHEVIGFSSIDGFNARECYAVGHNGEIWVFDGNLWTKEQSPTNVLLTKVVCDRLHGKVWIVGLAGTVIVGREGEWEIFEQTATKSDFWGVEAFRDMIFMSTDDGVYQVDGNELRFLRLEKKRSYTTSYLSTNGAELWSVGDKHIYRTNDGVRWARVPAP